MKFKLAVSALLSVAVSSVATAATEADVQQSFYPYKDGVPSFPGLTPGMKITADNADQFKDVLDPELYGTIKKGWMEMLVGKTTSFDLNDNYVEATRKGDVKLGAEVGQIEGWVAGRPFPEEPSMDDPRAGEKLAWNYKYGYNWGDSAAISPFYWKMRNMKTGDVERTLKFSFHFLNFKGRVSGVENDKIDLTAADYPDLRGNNSDLFRGIYAMVLEPFDVKNTQLLIHRAADDKKADNSYLYLGFQRRVRRLATGQITDAFLGTDLMIEDFEGYNGRVSDMKWEYKGTQNVMLPFYNHNEVALEDVDGNKEDDGYQFVSNGGKGGCYPNYSYQLRKAYVLEATPIDPNHPISKRIHYIDAQTYTIPRTNIYDRSGALWKTFIIGQAHPDSHLPINKGSGVSVDDGVAMVDVQAEHCTTAQFKGIVDPLLNPATMFTTSHMRKAGR